jgi:hypothetical protein
LGHRPARSADRFAPPGARTEPPEPPCQPHGFSLCICSPLFDTFCDA